MIEATPTEVDVADLNIRLIYKRALSAFGRMIGDCRRGKHLTITTLAQRTSISIKRLTKIENATSAPQWSEATALSCALQVRLSSMIKTVERAIGPLSEVDEKQLMAYVHAIADEERESYRRDAHIDDFIRNLQDTGLGESYLDVTISEWPAFFPPSLADNLFAEALALMQILDLLDGVAAPDGKLAPQASLIPPQERSRWLMLSVGQLISMSHFNLLGIRTRLSWIARRHAKDAPPTYVGHIENQCKRIGYAMTLIAPHRDRASVTDIESDEHSENIGIQTRDETVAEETLLPKNDHRENAHNAPEQLNSGFTLNVSTAIHQIACAGQMLIAMAEKLQQKNQ